MLKKIGKEEQALGDFVQLLRPDRFSSSPFNQMLAYQYAGQIRLNQSKERSRGQENLQKEGIQLLRVAASMWSQLSSRDPKIRDNYKLHDQCFIRLINAIKRDRSISDVEKAKNEARLLYMMGEPERALSILRTVENSEKSSGMNEMAIRCYLQNRDFESAVFFLSFLFSTKQLQKLRASNCHAPVLAYSLAARDKLMTVGNWAGFDLSKITAQSNFLRAFEYMLPRSPSELQFEGDEADRGDWHVTILHDPLDDDAASKAETVKDVLKAACGLRVTRMSDDVRPGRDEWSGTLHQADKCRLLMVVLGERELSEEFLQAYLGPCFSAPTQEGLSSPQRVVVQTQQHRKLPRTLTGYPSCLCPREILVDRQKHYFSEAEIDAICRFFCLMLGVDGLDPYLPS